MGGIELGTGSLPVDVSFFNALGQIDKYLVNEKSS